MGARNGRARLHLHAWWKVFELVFPLGEVGELDLNFHTLGTVELKYMMMTILFGVY